MSMASGGSGFESVAGVGCEGRTSLIKLSIDRIARVVLKRSNQEEAKGNERF